MIIENIKLTEIVEAENLIKKVFDESAAEDYTSAGIRHFYEKISESAIRERFSNGSMIIVAKADNRISGYLEITNSNHIYLLFVKKEDQHKGIGRKLIEFSLNLLRENDSELYNVTVNSTESAVKLYEKLGFVRLADCQYKNDMISYPMSIVIRY